MANFIHPLADVKSETIGEDTTIWQFSIVLTGAIIGHHCNINCQCFIEGKAIIGNYVTIKSGVQIWDGVVIEDNVFIGPNVTFTNDLVPRSKVYLAKYEKTLVRKGASVGANSTIVAGVNIGYYALIGAGSVVTKNIPSYTVWYGNPAIHKGYITSSGVIIGLDMIDKQTNQLYRLEDQIPVKC